MTTPIIIVTARVIPQGSDELASRRTLATQTTSFSVVIDGSFPGGQQPYITGYVVDTESQEHKGVWLGVTAQETVAMEVEV